jgi:hypothetical protein
MKKVIVDVVNFPNGCETVRFTACFVSMLMRAEHMTDTKKHNELYNLYNAVTGFSFLQVDLSNNIHMQEGWEHTSYKLLRKIDYYVKTPMDFAGYDFEEIDMSDQRENVFAKIKASLDKDIPVSMILDIDVGSYEFYQWVLVTGYDDDHVLYGLDGSQGYWGKSFAEPAGYDENGLFIMPDWYEKKGLAFILGEKKAPTVTLQDVFKRAIKIMESMKEKKYYSNSVDFMMNDANFENLSDEDLLKMRDRIAAWIGQPIDQRAMLGYAMNPLIMEKEASREVIALNEVHRLCWTMHDVLWIAWRAIGEYMGDNKLDWARGLKNKTIRRVIADCIAFVRDHDEYLLEELKKGFGE